MFCKHCGEDIGEGGQSCPKCGEATETQQSGQVGNAAPRHRLSPAESVSATYLITAAALTVLTITFFIVDLAVNKWANIDYLFFIILFGAGYFIKKQSPEKHQKYYGWLFLFMLSVLALLYVITIIIRAV